MTKAAAKAKKATSVGAKRAGLTATAVRASAALKANLTPEQVAQLVSVAIVGAIAARHPGLPFSWSLVPTKPRNAGGLGVVPPGQAWSATLDVVGQQLATVSGGQIIWDSNLTFDLRTLSAPLSKTHAEILHDVVTS
ncbi:MAG: hypothetical protein IPK81_03420 [Rhodospirillales bacterium]|nr:MAG: hypothetical protein IPK81_03420 [Rhodospirillales bacterium]